MHILFVCRKFDQVAGGVEKMSITLMNEMIKRGHQISLMTWDKTNAESHYTMSNKINWIKIPFGNADEVASWSIRFKRHKLMRSLIKKLKPNIIIGFQNDSYLSARISSLRMKIPVIAAERNSLDRFKFLPAGKFQKLIFWTFRYAAKITVQFDSYINMYPKYLRHKVIAIQNPVISKTKRITISNKKNRTILHIGRLSYQKNQTLLIQSFAHVVSKHPKWKLVIIGNGEDQDKLKTLVSDLKIENNIIFTGAIKNISKYFLQSQIFALPSRWEGFPNALCEAMAHGIPSIGLKETNGVNELIINGQNGILTNTNDIDFAQGIMNLIDNVELRKTMSTHSIESIKQYNPKIIFDKWENLFKSLKKVYHKKNNN